jgi:hypothetical protein
MSHKNETNNNNNNDNYSDKGQKSKFYSKLSLEKKSFGAFWWLLNQRRKSLPISNTNSSSTPPQTPPHKASVPSISMTPINEESNTITDLSEEKLSTLTRIANNRSSRPNSTIEILKQSTIVSIT